MSKEKYIIDTVSEMIPTFELEMTMYEFENKLKNEEGFSLKDVNECMDIIAVME